MPSERQNEPEKKRKRARKGRSRTNAVDTSSSSSSSSSDSEEATPEPQTTRPSTTAASRRLSDIETSSAKSKKQKRASKAKSSIEEGIDTTSESIATQWGSTPEVVNEKPSTTSAFESFYMQRVTGEFANDLEKLRAAPDFKDSTVPILVKALRQGVDLFREEERVVVMRSVGVGMGVR